MSADTAPSPGLTDEEFSRYDALAAKAKSGLSDQEFQEYDALASKARAPSRPKVDLSAIENFDVNPMDAPYRESTFRPSTQAEIDARQPGMPGTPYARENPIKARLIQNAAAFENAWSKEGPAAQSRLLNRPGRFKGLGISALAPGAGLADPNLAADITDVGKLGGAILQPVFGLADVAFGKPSEEATAPTLGGRIDQNVRQAIRTPLDLPVALGEVTRAGNPIGDVLDPIARSVFGEHGPDALATVTTLLAGAKMMPGGERAPEAASPPIDPTRLWTGERSTPELPYSPRVEPLGLPNEMSKGVIVPGQRLPIAERANPYTQIDPAAVAPEPVAAPRPVEPRVPLEDVIRATQASPETIDLNRSIGATERRQAQAEARAKANQQLSYEDADIINKLRRITKTEVPAEPAAPSAPDVPVAPVAPDPSPAGGAAKPKMGGRRMNRGGRQAGELTLPDVTPAVESVRAGARKVGEFIDEHVSRQLRLLDKFGQNGEGQQLRYGIQDVLSRVRSGENQAMLRLDDTHAAFDSHRALSDTYHRLGELVRGEVAPKNAAEAQLRDATRATFEDVARTANESGVRIEDAKAPGGARPVPMGWKEFWPQILKPDVIEALRAASKDAVATLKAANPGKEAAVDAWLQKYRSPRVESFHPGTEMPREFTVPKEWLETDGRAVVERYVRQALQNAAEVDVFKLRRDVTDADGNVRSVRDQGQFGDLLAKIGDEDAKRVALRVLGRDPEARGSVQRGLGKLTQIEGNVTTGRLLGGITENVVQQVTQPVNTIMGSSFKSLGKGVASWMKDPAAAYRRAVESGAITPGAFLHHLGFDTTSTGKFARAVNISTKPLQWHDTFWRVIQNETSPYAIREWQAELRAGGKKASRRAKMLADMDLTPEQIQRLADGKVTKRDVNFIKQRIQSALQIEGGPENLPYTLGSQHPLVVSMRRLKTFSIGQARAHVNFAIKPALRGDIRPLAKLIGAGIVVGDAITSINRTAFGPKRDVPQWDEITTAIRDGKEDDATRLIAQRLLVDAKAASFFGIIGNAATSVVGGRNGKSAVGNFLDNTLTPASISMVKTTGQAWDHELNVKGSSLPEDVWNFIRRNMVGIQSALKLYEANTKSGLKAAKLRAMTQEGEWRKGDEEYGRRLAKTRALPL